MSDFHALRTTLKQVRLDGNRVQELVIQAMEQALRGLNNQWDDLTPDARELSFNKIVYVAKEELLHKDFGGRADDGWNRSKFGEVMATCRRSIMYDVPVSVAMRATHEKLRAARRYVEINLKAAGGTYRDKMVCAFETLKEEEDKRLEQIKSKGIIKKAGQQVVGQSTAVKKRRVRFFQLPEADDIEPQDFPDVFMRACEFFLGWMESPGLQPMLMQTTEIGSAGRMIRYDLTTVRELKIKSDGGRSGNSAVSS